jgi:phosphomannomutase
MGVVKFGTDGWRGIIADDFTYENVRVAARAIAHYVIEHEDASAGVCIGYDTRFGSKSFARVVAEVLAGAGIPVALANKVTPTPELSFAVRGRKAAGGVMITSSHNPAEWNGVKYKASYGGSGSPKIIGAIETAAVGGDSRCDRGGGLCSSVCGGAGGVCRSGGD